MSSLRFAMVISFGLSACSAEPAPAQGADASARAPTWNVRLSSDDDGPYCSGDYGAAFVMINPKSGILTISIANPLANMADDTEAVATLSFNTGTVLKSDYALLSSTGTTTSFEDGGSALRTLAASTGYRYRDDHNIDYDIKLPDTAQLVRELQGCVSRTKAIQRTQTKSVASAKVRSSPSAPPEEAYAFEELCRGGTGDERVTDLACEIRDKAPKSTLLAVADSHGVWAVFPRNRPDLDRLRLSEARKNKLPIAAMEITDPESGLTIPAPEVAARNSGLASVDCRTMTYERWRMALPEASPATSAAMKRCMQK